MEFETVSLSADAIEKLDRDLSFEMNRLLPTTRGSESFSLPPAKGIEAPPQAEQMEEIRDEILDTAGHGLRIASQVESRPLIKVYQAAKADIPPAIAVDHKDMKYDFYLAEMTLGSLLEEGMFLKQARIDLIIRDDIVKPERKVRPVHLFPDRKDITYFGADITAAIGIDFDLNIKMPAAANQVIPFARAEASADIKAGFLIGPLQYSLRKAAIEVTGLSDQHVTWRYNLASELSGLNDFKFLLVLKIAQEARDVFLDVTAKVKPSRKRWLVFQETLPEFSMAKHLRVELS